MRRQVNLKACLILLVTAGILAACTTLLHAVQYRRSAHLLLVQATRAEESGTPRKALGFYSMYLRMAPKETDARERFALLLSRSSDRPEDQELAFYALDRVLLEAPDRHQTRRKVVEIALSLGRPKDALYHLEILRKQFPNAVGPDEYEQFARAERDSQHFPKAAEYFQEALDRDPGRIKSSLALATLLRKKRLPVSEVGKAGKGSVGLAAVLRKALEKPEEVADAIIEEMVEKSKDRDKAMLTQIEYQREFHSDGLEESRKTLPDLVKRLARDNPDVLLLAAEMAQDRRDFDAARRYLEQGLKRDGKDLRFLQAVARLELEAGRRDEALRRLRQALEHLPNDLLSIYNTTNLLLDAEAIDEAEGILVKIERDRLTEGILDYLDARINLSKKKWARALELLGRAREELARPPVLPEILRQAHLLAGECHRQLGNPDQHLEACRAALAVDATWWPAQMSRASAVQALGRFEEAARYYAAVADRAPEARLAAARLWLALFRRQPGNRQPLHDAAALLKGVSPSLAARADYRLLHVELLTAQGELDKAREEADQGCREFSGDPSFWVARAELMLLGGRTAAVPAFLAEAEKATGSKASPIRLALLRHHQSTGNKQAVGDLLAGWEKPEAKLSPKEEAAWLRGLASFHLSRGERQEAGKVLDRLVALTPGDLSVYPMVLDVLAAKPDRERLVELVAKLRELEGDDGALWRFAEAVRLITVVGLNDRSARERVRPLLEEVRKRRPSWPAPLVLEGMVDESEGILGRALERYQQAVNLGEGRPVVVRRLVELYSQHHRYADAQKVIATFQEKGSLGDVGRLATEISLSAREDPKQTLVIARQAVSEQSTDYRDHLWLGQVLWALRQPQDAEKELREAVKRGPGHPEVWVARVQFLVEHGRRREAEEEARQAEKHLEGDEAPLALAACYEAIGDRARAAEQFKKLLAAQPDHPGVLQAVSLFHLRGGDFAQAEGYLRKLVPGTTVHAGWARRILALTLAAGGSYQRSSEALALLEENRQGRQVAPEDQWVKALVHATRPGGRREAIENLEASFLQIPPADDERFLLATLHAANRNWPRAREEFLRLLTGAGPINPGYLAVFVQHLIQQDDLDSAAHWLEVLEKLEAKELRPVFLRARLLHARKEGARVVALLRSQADPGADPARVLAVARLLDQLGHAPAAEPYYRAFADSQGKTKPASLVPLIGYLGRQNRLQEALDLCEQLGGKVPDEDMAPVWIDCLRSGRPNAGQVRRVEAWVQDARKKQKPPNTSLYDLALANLRDLQGKPGEAEKIYRDLLQRDPRNLVAANNLAVLLSLQGNKGPEALEQVRHAIDVGGPRPTLLDTRAMVHMTLEQWGEAIKDLEEVVSMEPRPTSYLRLARAYEKTRDRRAARAALKKAHDGGVKVGDLHPLERPAYEPLLREMEGN